VPVRSDEGGTRALARTADRVGLVVCADLPVAISALGEFGAGEPIDSLVDWALSPEHFRARETLGLSIAG
jgi:hypothetical protein